MKQPFTIIVAGLAACTIAAAAGPDAPVDKAQATVAGKPAPAVDKAAKTDTAADSKRAEATPAPKGGKPGALRNGLPFREWALPPVIQLVRDRILKQPRGDRAFVELLLMAREFGLEPLQVACELVLDGHVVTASVVMNEMRRLVAPVQPEGLTVSNMPKLQTEPLADCGRYDRLREVSHVVH